ncbi:hypothetical protein NDU88_000054 [Pleurodeles waltl]|uniref:Uncharacterized protein n=1 Tax=Pleurodeles waltl TaxID=8319 RepID=A0AAV7KVG9_PLEWA|nr:hypothetical protein NDU88_000054 [Pleurodeles waltl]
MRCGAGEAGVQASDARRALSDTETQSSRTYEAWLGGELDPIDIGLAVHRRVRTLDRGYLEEDGCSLLLESDKITTHNFSRMADD